MSNEEEVKEQQPAIQSDQVFQDLLKHHQGHGEDNDQDESSSPMYELITEKN